MNRRCPHCQYSILRSYGSFVRKSDSKTLRRWQCKSCHKTFSDATFSSFYRQHKRRVNNPLRLLLSSGVSQRRSAIILGLTRKTVARKLRFLAIQARLVHQKRLRRQPQETFNKLQLDDLITIEHTKLKPLSTSVLVSKTTRMILGIEVGSIPSFGPLSRLSRKKYGKRKNEHSQKLDELFEKVCPYLPAVGRIETDQHKNYPPVIGKHLKDWEHQTYKGKRASVAGQGELKMRGFDPLFCINHTLAMLRANVNRLFRRSWNTTKRPDALLDHLWLFVDFYNGRLESL
jgi:transposase-like protein